MIPSKQSEDIEAEMYSSIWDEAFWENCYQLKVIIFAKCSTLDVLQGSEQTSRWIDHSNAMM